jgi:hypothetical protein
MICVYCMANGCMTLGIQGFITDKVDEACTRANSACSL